MNSNYSYKYGKKVLLTFNEDFLQLTDESAMKLRLSRSAFIRNAIAHYINSVEFKAVANALPQTVVQEGEHVTA